MDNSIAVSIGLVPMDIDCLVTGKATFSLAAKLRVTQTDIEDFINGFPSKRITQRLGLRSISAAEELSRVCGNQGAIGIIMGLPFPR